MLDLLRRQIADTVDVDQRLKYSFMPDPAFILLSDDEYAEVRN